MEIRSQRCGAGRTGAYIVSSGGNSRVDDLARAGQKCAARILCLGNELLGDDSLGSVVCARLQQLLAAEVEIVNSPESGLSLPDYVLDVDQLIIIDTVQSGTAPLGTIYQLREEDLQVDPGGSAHYLGLLDVLAFARHLRLPVAKQVLILAVEIQDSYIIGQEMHPAVVASIPPLLERVRAVLTKRARGSVFTPIADRKSGELPEKLPISPK